MLWAIASSRSVSVNSAGTFLRIWSAFVRSLREAGYDDVLSIENEDVSQPAEEGVKEAAAFMLPLLSD